MAYDFPASPTPDQEFTPVGGPTYIWKSPRWFVKGGTMGGDGGSGVVDWAAITGKPSTFPPTVPIPWTDVSGKPATFPPTLPIAQSDVTGLVTGQAAQDTAISGKVAKAGDTMTGNLVINTGVGSGIVLNATGATSNTILGSKGAGVPRWNLKLGDEGVESGGNAGSNLVLNRYNDDGSGGATAITINRATRAMVIWGDLTAAAALYSTAFASSTTTAVLCTTTAGTVTLRPNGAASTVNQVALTSAGVFTLATTPAPGDNSLQAATTAFVTAAVAAGGGAVSWASITGKPSTFPPTVPIAQVDITNLITDLAAKAPLVSPALTNTPTAPTAAPGTNTTQLATTAFVAAAITANVEDWSTITGKPATFPPTLPIAWTDVSGKPATFPPTLPIAQADVTGLVAGQSAQDTAITGKVAKTGDVMTGSLSIYGSGTTYITLNKPASGQMTYFEGRMNNQSRWRLVFGDSTTESGSNVGSNFAIERSDDAGTFIDQVIKIDRATGIVNFSQPPTVNSAPIGGGGAATEVGDTPPLSPTQGQLWFDSSTANLYLYYDDGTSAQWVQVNATGAA